ncbi:CHAD domain-containing protein [Phragmitibacter flavus]|uniref:CHAD domain-containing protein n=1 Tax=Phragmitibacter flavus TaxID=2576071 RepID=A0A5R8KGB7_9BACT|nr:CHAD domain-containing protein [Phragmitibacter flavus]TLD71348.1 CHAD domain-containing protein [Phragmitibacter flavus]
MRIIKVGFRLEQHEQTGSGLRRVLIEQTIKLCDDLNLEDQETAIHEARKRCKRVRAVVRLLRPTCPEVFKRENAAFRNMAASLSDLRDVTARADAFRVVVEGDTKGARPFEPLRSILQAHHQVTSKPEIKRKLSAVLKEAQEGRVRLEKLKFPGYPEFELIEKGLRRSYRCGRKAMKEAHQEKLTPSFHDWRKRVKDFGYQMQLLRDLWPPLLKPFRDQVHALGEILGQEHDLIVLREKLKENAGQISSQEVYDAFDNLLMNRVQDLQIQARRLGARIYAEEVGCFARRIKTYWSIWREG